ncbi:hypothetical protein MC885_015169, partial [Smutsia gigantea]
MTKSNGEEPRMGGRMERFQQGVRKRTLLAKKKVQNITKEEVKSYLFRNAFVLFTVTAVIVGTILGFTLRPYKMSYREVKYFSFPGELLMRMLQMLVLPLIISSLVTENERFFFLPISECAFFLNHSPQKESFVSPVFWELGSITVGKQSCGVGLIVGDRGVGLMLHRYSNGWSSSKSCPSVHAVQATLYKSVLEQEERASVQHLTQSPDAKRLI